jgi:hypothetical protein
VGGTKGQNDTTRVLDDQHQQACSDFWNQAWELIVLATHKQYFSGTVLQDGSTIDSLTVFD